MRKLALCLISAGALWAAPLFQASFDSNAKQWEALRGVAAPDPQVKRGARTSLRVEPSGEPGDAVVRSAPVSLRIGKRYELSGWVRTEKLEVRDLDRSPIAVGAALAMESMPFDVHSESVGGTTRLWARLSLKFTATRSQDRILLTVGNGGAFRGKAWFEGVTLDEVSNAGEWPSKAALKTFGPAYRYPSGGWIYLHIQGQPYERGYQHGILLAKEIEQYLERCAAQLDAKSRERAWSNGRTAANALFLRGFDKEILEEMKGIADGAAAAGAKWGGRPVDLVDIVTANTITELGELNAAMPMTPHGLEGLNLRRPDYASEKKDVPVTERCSAFAATGKATRDGKMVIAHITMWSLTLAEQTNIMLDVQPTQGHRVLMQSYPGGIQSGTDYYQNDAGVVLTETTIRQSPFNIEGTPVAYRARKAIQYGDDVDAVVKHLATKNNGLYTNEWLIGDAKNNEVAMFELGTYKTKLWRSSKNEWFGGTDGFYWGCNNAKDLRVRLEYVPDPKGKPEHLPFVPAARDLKWQELYQQHKGKIDEQFAFLAFRTAPLVSSSSMDAKVTTAEMASNLMSWAVFGKPNQREWVPSPRQKESYAGNQGLYSSGYRLFQARAPEALEEATAAAKEKTPDAKEEKKDKPASYKDRLWKGWILPAADGDTWLSAGSASYYAVLSGEEIDKQLEFCRAEYRAAARNHEQPLSRLSASLRSSDWYRVANAKGVLLLDALRRESGDDKFLALMRDFFDKNATKSVSAAQFVAAAGKPEFFARWLDALGLPEDRGGPSYTAGMLGQRLGSAVIVYGTTMDAGANRFAAEQLQKKFLDWFESAVPIRKDFEVTEEDLEERDVVFVGRPETNSLLNAWKDRIRLVYDGAVFRINGKEHASEREALMFAAANPANPNHMVLVIAGNSALETVRLARSDPDRYQYVVRDADKTVESGFMH